ncbi:hypothetical protein ABZ733_36940 [Streptomyces longwoodensis]|uniref:hypothetical protein n=1 Tax=Streptomyces longwoodensis TaxID=68231 RepID=UPI00340361DF
MGERVHCAVEPAGGRRRAGGSQSRTALLRGLDDALAGAPASSGAGLLDGRLAGARAWYDQGAHARLLAALPGLISDAHHGAASRRSLDQVRLSAVYSLASTVLVKLGSHDRARLPADRARTCAEMSGFPLPGPQHTSRPSCCATRTTTAPLSA